MKRYSVKEAAQVLGVGTDAVRKRVQRDTITHERVDGTVYVWLDDDEPRHDMGVSEDLIGAYKEQLESYKEQVEYLRREVEDWKEESRRKDAILMTMAQRIPELEAATESRESHISASEEQGDGDVPPEQEKPVSWWRRIFGG